MIDTRNAQFDISNFWISAICCSGNGCKTLIVKAILIKLVRLNERWRTNCEHEQSFITISGVQEENACLIQTVSGLQLFEKYSLPANWYFADEGYIFVKIVDTIWDIEQIYVVHSWVLIFPKLYSQNAFERLRRHNETYWKNN